MALHFRLLDAAGARAVATWRYPPPYTLYQIELTGTQLEEGIAFLIDPANCYYRIDNDHGELEAFCCYGYDAQVEGGDYTEEALDLGLGLHPDLTGQGRGLGFVRATINVGIQIYQPSLLRVTIAGFNARAQHVWQKAGFRQTQSFQAEHQQTFLIFTRSAEGFYDYSD
jgi:[ribosomal protein S18]-alanine N-acetyltransferase